MSDQRKEVPDEEAFSGAREGGQSGEGMDSSAEAVLDDVDSLRQALLEQKAKAEGYLANWQRAQADFINLKRRSEQEKKEVTQFANSVLIQSLLPVLDDLERALVSVSPDLAEHTWADGVWLIYRKLCSILEAQGLSQVKALGEPFDPNLHDALMYVEGEEGKVIEEVQKGYRLYDRVIRPAMVIVGGRKGTVQAEEESSSEEGK